MIDGLDGKPFFLFPLQLSGDYQIRSHSPFPDMRRGGSLCDGELRPPRARRRASADQGASIRYVAFQLAALTSTGGRAGLGFGERVHFIDGGNLEQLAAERRGMVCVNSTSATLALAAGRPVCTLGEAIYKVPGLTFARHLDEFWTDPMPPEPGLVRRVPPRAGRPLPRPWRDRQRVRRADVDQVDAGAPRLLA